MNPPPGASFRSGESGRMATDAAALAAMSRMLRPGCTGGVAEAVEAAASAAPVAAAQEPPPVFDADMSMRCSAVPRLAPLSSGAAVGGDVAAPLLLRSVSRLNASVFRVWPPVRDTGETLE